MFKSLLTGVSICPLMIAIFVEGCSDRQEQLRNAEAQKILQQAFDAASHIQNDKWKARAMRQIAEGQAKDGDLDTAFETARKIQGNIEMAEALAGIAATQLKRGDSAGGAKTFGHAVDLLPDNADGRRALHEIILVRGRAGDVSGAPQLTHEQTDAYSKTLALLGVAKGILTSRGVATRPK